MRFQYYNANPLGKHEEDCVCRAISLGLNEDYRVIEYKLFLISELFECEELCMCCYQHLLEEVYKLKRNDNYRGTIINEFLDTHPYGKYLIRIDGHLTCAYNGKILDTWDTNNEIIDVVWEI